MHCGCLTLETLYLNNIIHQSGIRIWWCFPLKKKHDFKWRRSDLTIVGTPHQVAGQQDLPWNIQLMPILFDDKHVDLPVYIYIYIYVERTFWVYFVPTLICPHACFLAHVHIYIYTYVARMVMNQFANSWITRGWGFPVPALRISCWYDSGTPNTCELWDKKRDLRLETTGGDPSKYPKTMVKVQANYINWGE